MNRLILVSLLATSVALPAAPALSQSCPAGKTASGECVNANLADVMQQTAIILSQPKISGTAYPVLPSGDANFQYPNELTVNPLPPSPLGKPKSNAAP